MTGRHAPIVWTPDLAYAVGLIATDGCLVGDGRHVAFVSKDRDLVETLLRCVGARAKIGVTKSGLGRWHFRAQIGDVVLYRWLLTIGLTPWKSLTLGALGVPEHLLPHLVRGLLDGDGTILNRVNRADTSRRDDYYWECLQVKFASASLDHLRWLRERLRSALGIEGYLRTETGRPGRHPLSVLRYGKRASVVLLPWLYRDGATERLDRKWRIWSAYVQRSEAAPSSGTRSLPGPR